MAEPWIHEMIDKLLEAKKKTSPVFAAYTNMTGLSKAQFYRIAKKSGWKPYDVKKENELRRQLYGK